MLRGISEKPYDIGKKLPLDDRTEFMGLVTPSFRLPAQIPVVRIQPHQTPEDTIRIPKHKFLMVLQIPCGKSDIFPGLTGLTKALWDIHVPPQELKAMQVALEQTK